MDSSTSKGEMIMRPVLLKAGIPLAISLAGFICGRFMAARGLSPKYSLPENSLESDSHEDQFRDEDQEIMASANRLTSSTGSSKIQYNVDQEEILGLRAQIQELRMKESELEMQFTRYQDSKEQESMLMEIRNMLVLERAYVEFLDRDISSLEAENRRLENMVIQYLRVLEQLQSLKLQNSLLRRKVNKVSGRWREQLQIVREKDLEIKAREVELSKNLEDLEIKTGFIKKFEGEVEELQAMVGQLTEEKNEVLSMLNLAEEKQALSHFKDEDEGMTITMEDYKKLVEEHKAVQNDRRADIKELIYLRWSNACLKHELMRLREEQEKNQSIKNHPDQELEGNEEIRECGLDGLAFEKGEPCGGMTTTGSHICSKRRKLIQKLKKWVEGSEKMKSKLDEKDRNETKCFGRHSVFDKTEEEMFVLARK